MKRCPQCNRVETDDKLIFCRVDGTALISDSRSFNRDAGTAKFGSPVSSEIETSILPHTSTTSENDRPAARTTVVPPTHAPGTTRAFRKLKRPKGITAVTIGALALAAIIIGLTVSELLYRTRTFGPTITSIAVMPFVNASSNADVEYLSDGMTETLIGNLSQLPNLSVKARSSVFRYKGKEADAKTIGRELGVQALLNGRVIQRAEQLSLNLELIDAQTENVIWTDQYDRKSSGLVSLRNEVARDVSSKLKVKLSGADQQKLANSHTNDPEAYRLYLQGRFYLNKRVGKLYDRAESYLKASDQKRPKSIRRSNEK